jgi:hypothetical protein
MIGRKWAAYQVATKLEKLYLGILVVIFAGIVLQAPISVGFGTLFPHYDLLIKSWAEILMLVASVLSIILLNRKDNLSILKEPLMIGIGIYATVHILLVFVFGGSLNGVAAGLIIDLRYVLFFVLVYIAMRLYPNYKVTFIKAGIVGALVVLIFAVLQVFVLPADILKYIGYNTHTIAPYLTVDQNNAFVRIDSTLRGPNPLGAYAGIILALLTGFWLKGKRTVSKRTTFILIILSASGLVAVWASYSRSAVIGVLVAVGIVLVTALLHKLSRRVLIGAGVVIVVGLSAFALTSHSNFFSNVVLHNNPMGGSSTKSDQGHVSSLQSGMGLLLSQPFGAGIGSTGSASLYTKSPLIIENQYLFIAHEIGWFGLAFYILIFIGILTRLWQRRNDWLALGVFASGIGLVIIGLLLPVWVDDTVSIVWWGLAALAIGARRE